MKAIVAFVAVCVVLAASQTSAAPKLLGKGPYAIAHRGLSGVFPEHTIRAYQAAIDVGAHFIECDVVPTKDCRLICRHEPDLSATTDAPSKFPQLKKTVNIDGADVEGIFSFDLTLAQIKTLRAVQQNANRDQNYNGQFQVPTLGEYIRTAQAATRVVGIYPETKHPSFVDSLQLTCFNGKSFTQAVVDELTKFGYTGRVGSTAWLQRPAFLQSFERSNLLSVAKKTKVPLVFLTDEFQTAIPGETTTYGDIMGSSQELSLLKSQGIAGIGPWKNTLVAYTPLNYINESTIAEGKRTVDRVHKAGLQMHIYTLRNEPKRPDGSGYLPWNFAADPYLEYDLFFKQLKVDGAFSDHVHTLARYVKDKM